MTQMHCLRIAAFVCSIGITSITAAATINDIKLKPKRLEGACTPTDGEHPVSLQASSHYALAEKYGLSKPPLHKAYESFDCGGKKSTLYYYEYGTRQTADMMKGFTEGLMWGEDGPTTEHPELVVQIDNVIVVISSRTPNFFKDRLPTRDAEMAATTLVPKTTPAPTATGNLVRSFAVAGHGSLELDFPKAWKSTMEPDPALPAPIETIRLEPPDGAEFVVMITPLWSPRGDPGFNRPEAVRRNVDNDRIGMAPDSVEKELVIVAIDGPSLHGYYFVATDKAPRPGSWEYVYRGGAGVGDLLLSVSIFSHRKESPSIQAALAMLRKARQTGG